MDSIDGLEWKWLKKITKIRISCRKNVSHCVTVKCNESILENIT